MNCLEKLENLNINPTWYWYEICILLGKEIIIVPALAGTIFIRFKNKGNIMVEIYAREDSIYERKLQEVEEVMRKVGISIIDDQIHFDDGKIFSVVDVELRSGFNPDIVAIPREDESCRLMLHEYIEKD